jgi:integrase
MARRIRNNALENRTGRLKLPSAKKPVFVRIGAGISLGYRRNKTAGTWVLKLSDGKGGAKTSSIGIADDFDEDDGFRFLSYWQAQDAAKKKAISVVNGVAPTLVTVRAATETYLIVLTGQNPRTAADTKGRLVKHFLPKFGSQLVSSLTKTKLDGWLASMIKPSDDPEAVRRSKDSANRVLSMVKALLNHAVRDPANHITDDSAWRLVKPFHGVSKPRDIRYTAVEVRKLIDSAANQETANIIIGCYLTGARYGELAETRISHFDADNGSLRINTGKTGSRNVILQSSAINFFKAVTKDRSADEYIFVRNDGTRWKRSDQTRPIKEALRLAGLPTEGSLYALRHTYVSMAIEGGIPLNLIAENCGTSVRMIEKTYSKILAENRREFIEQGAPKL